VFNNDSKGANFGIVNVKVDGCVVMFWTGLKSSSTNIKAGAEDVIVIGKNKIVVGNKIHDVIYEYPDPEKKQWNNVAISIQYCSENSTHVANNLISKGKTNITLDEMTACSQMWISYP